MTLRSVNFLYELNHTSQYICSNSRSSNALHWVEFAGTVTVLISHTYCSPIKLVFHHKVSFYTITMTIFPYLHLSIFLFYWKFFTRKKKTCILNVIVRNKYALCYIKLYILKNLAGSTRMIVNPKDIYRS